MSSVGSLHLSGSITGPAQPDRSGTIFRSASVNAPEAGHDANPGEVVRDGTGFDPEPSVNASWIDAKLDEIEELAGNGADVCMIPVGTPVDISNRYCAARAEHIGADERAGINHLDAGHAVGHDLSYRSELREWLVTAVGR